MSVSTSSVAQDELLQELARLVEEDLEGFLAGRALPPRFAEAVGYALFGGGKRLRPVLVMLACEAVGASRRAALPAAGALEMIHAFSLVHDDLPAMDDDDIRRGRPTLHRHADEATAILAGDVLTTLAFERVAEGFEDPAQVGRITRELAAGATAMIAGQVRDTLKDFEAGLEDAARRVECIHRDKTAALLRAACRMGAICGGADAAALEALTRYGERLGLMFQVVDDVLDVTQTAEHLGKATGKDAEAGKLTYPGVFGLDRCREEIERLRAEAVAALAPLPAPGPLEGLANRMAVRTR